MGASRGAPRDWSCARRERWGQLGFRAVARGGSGCRRSYARSGPVPLPPGLIESLSLNGVVIVAHRLIESLFLYEG